jgi:hypothetical protein
MPVSLNKLFLLISTKAFTFLNLGHCFQADTWKHTLAMHSTTYPGVKSVKNTESAR